MFIQKMTDKVTTETTGAKPALGPNCMIPYIKKGV